LPEVPQGPPRGYKLKARDSKIGKRQKQEDHHEKDNGGHLKRDDTALIR